MQNEMQRQAQTLNEQSVQHLQTAELLGYTFTVYGTKTEPLFLAKEVGDALEHSNYRMMIDSVDEDEKGVRIVYTRGGPQRVSMLTEYGLYEVLMQSRKPIAKDFKRGLKRLLKSIRLGETIEGKKLPRAARYKGFFEWQAQVRRYIRPEDKRTIADLYGCCISHVRKVMAGSTMTMPLARLISEYAHENYKQGIRADLPSFEFQPMLFTEAELEGCMLNA